MIDFAGVIEDLKRDEGWRATVYQDHLGFWTIGYGFLVDERKDAGLPLSIGEAWLEYALSKRWNDLTLQEPWINEQPQEVQRALANMCYQLGVAGLRKFRRMLSALQDGDRERAATEALDSKWAKQTPSRAHRVAGLLKGKISD